MEGDVDLAYSKYIETRKFLWQRTLPVVNRDISESCRVNYRDSKYAKTNEIPKVDRFGPLDQVSFDIAKKLQ